MEVRYLCDNIQYIDTVTKWIYDEFINGIRSGISYEKLESSFKQRKKDSLPITIITVDKYICMGVVSLVINDLKEREYTPWLAGLYVAKEFRNKGTGNVLINEIKNIASRIGYDVLYLRTEHASEYYKKLGWEFVESLTDEFGLQTNVFKISL